MRGSLFAIVRDDSRVGGRISGYGWVERTGGTHGPFRPRGQRAEGEGSTEQKEREQEYEEAKEEIHRLEEEGPPEDLEDWPEGKAKYETFGGPEGEHGYHEGPEEKLGPSSLRHHEDGNVSIEGEEVDDPDEYKGEPIPGGPTDPDTPNLRSDKADADDDDGSG
jgi:hypothetical protein